MTEKSNQNAPPESDAVLREIRDVVHDIHDILLRNQEAKDGNAENGMIGMHQHRKMADVYITKDVVLQQLRICDSTLAKWRYNKCIKYVHRGSRTVVYSFVDLMDALADNKLAARGFNPFIAYKRMLEWYKKSIEPNGQQ